MILSPVLVRQVLDELAGLYPEVGTTLKFSSPFELLVATMLSAQSTDKQVNKITQSLFEQYNTPRDFALLEPEELEKLIKGCGLYRNKSKNIVQASRILVDQYNGKVPQDLESLTKLPGVGRKTANVILSNAFGKNAIAVDTHVFRVANRLGLADSKTPERTEFDLRQVIPEELWSKAHHWLITHGREICLARNPRCLSCTLQHLCKTNLS
jgi:endonuclease-3